MKEFMTTMSNEEIYNKLCSLRNDDIIRQIETLVQKKSMAELYGIALQETSHSCFLSELFRGSPFNLGSMPFERLLTILNRRADTQHKGESVFPEWLKKAIIIKGDINVKSIDVKTEVCTEDKKRVDIHVASEVDIHTEDSIKRITLVIENKVLAPEHNEQTMSYYKYFEDKKENDEIILFVYLTPMPSIDLDNLPQPKCACKEFIQINYQDILEYILEPALKQLEPNSREWYCINDYVHTLGVPLKDNDNNNIIMAISMETKDLLTSFFERYRDLIITALDVIANDSRQDEETREPAKRLRTSLQKFKKDTTQYIYRKNRLGKGRLVLEVIKDYALAHPDKSINDLKNDFDLGKNTIQIYEEIKGKDKDRYFKEPIPIGNKEYAISNQWRKGKEFDKFLACARKHCPIQTADKG